MPFFSATFASRNVTTLPPPLPWYHPVADVTRSTTSVSSAAFASATTTAAAIIATMPVLNATTAPLLNATTTPSLSVNTSASLWWSLLSSSAATATATATNPLYAGTVVFIVAGAVGNLLVCLAICLERSLQNVTNYFLLSLAVADLLVSCVVMPFGLVAGLLDEWPMGPVWCNFYVTCDVLACTSSIWHMCFISLTRYLGIRRPLRHLASTTGSVQAAVKRAALVWLLSLTICSYVTVLGIIDIANIMPSNKVCAINNRVFFVVGSLVAFFIPMTIMTVTYTLTALLLSKKRYAHVAKNRHIGGASVGTLTPAKMSTRLYNNTSDNTLCRPQQQPPPSWRRQADRPAALCRCKTSERQQRATGLPRAPLYTVPHGAARPAVSGHDRHSTVARDEGQLSDCLAATVATASDTSAVSAAPSEGSDSECHSGGAANRQSRDASVARQRHRFCLGLLACLSSDHRQQQQEQQEREHIAAPVASCSHPHPHLPHHQLALHHHNHQQQQQRQQQQLPCLRRSTSAHQLSAERKASKVLGLVFAAFVACWLPFFTLNTARGVFGPVHVNEHIEALCLWLGYVSSTINPIIYTSVNRTFRATFARLLTCRCGHIRQRMRRARRRRVPLSEAVLHPVSSGQQQQQQEEEDQQEERVLSTSGQDQGRDGASLCTPLDLTHSEGAPPRTLAQVHQHHHQQQQQQ